MRCRLWLWVPPEIPMGETNLHATNAFAALLSQKNRFFNRKNRGSHLYCILYRLSDDEILHTILLIVEWRWKLYRTRVMGGGLVFGWTFSKGCNSLGYWHSEEIDVDVYWEHMMKLILIAYTMAAILFSLGSLVEVNQANISLVVILQTLG